MLRGVQIMRLPDCEEDSSQKEAERLRACQLAGPPIMVGFVGGRRDVDDRALSQSETVVTGGVGFTVRAGRGKYGSTHGPGRRVRGRGKHGHAFIQLGSDPLREQTPPVTGLLKRPTCRGPSCGGYPARSGPGHRVRRLGRTHYAPHLPLYAWASAFILSLNLPGSSYERITPTVPKSINALPHRVIRRHRPRRWESCHGPGPFR